ncbi:hypothetical protein IFM89_030513 [Coptis chinensis]|uniref:Vacuolar iron transporter n=1 Tax=Coptis chinensis TaxID=261450 RepID=A0A835HNC0_9MAGN|nr:hypothetical protein IFM89_030513 [Coptis chinensis]
MLGMATASKDRRDMILVGVAAVVVGAFSMAVGEYVSLVTQRDIKEAKQLTNMKLVNMTSITPKRGSIYARSPGKSPIVRGMSPAMELLYMLPKRSPLIRVISEEERAVTTDNDYETLPNPMKAACASGFAFLRGSLLPMLSVMIATDINRVLKLVIVKLR